MNLNFYTEARYIKGKDGKIYSPKDVLKYSLFKRYLSVFDEVNVVARVKVDENYIGNESDLVEGKRVKIIPITYYIGPLDFLKKRNIIFKEIKNTITIGDSYILRVPGNIGSIAYSFLIKNNIKYGVEVVGDPYEVFSNTGIKHPLRVFFKYYNTFRLKKIVKEANSALYVTKEILQKRYPNKCMYSASNVEINISSLLNRDHKTYLLNKFLRIISIGSLEQMYKAPDVVIKSLEILNHKGIETELLWIGDGVYKEEMVNLANDLGVKVKFLGFIGDRDLINYYLDQSDIFILASRTEGLPRVIIEAFSRSLPVLGSNVGGIPELLPHECLFQNEDYVGLSKLIENNINQDKLHKMGIQNLALSKNFTVEKLQEERNKFYKSII